MSSDVQQSRDRDHRQRWAGTVFQEAGPEEQKARESNLTVFMRYVKELEISADRS